MWILGFVSRLLLSLDEIKLCCLYCVVLLMTLSMNLGNGHLFQQGQGYSLPADIQYLDARWDVLVVLPLRDCFAQDS